MNIQAADILSLFPGVDSLDNLQQTLAADGALPETFANTLMAEIQQLQTALQQEQAGADFTLSHVNPQTREGNLLPAGGNIDLEQTFQALTDIVNRLKSLELSGENDQQIQDVSQFSPVIAIPLSSQESNQKEAGQESDPIALALAAIQQTINKTPEPVEVVTESQKQFENNITKESMPLSERLLQSQNLEKSSALMSTARGDEQASEENSQSEQSFYKNNPMLLSAEQKNNLVVDDEVENKASVHSESKGGTKKIETAPGLMELNRAISSLPQTKTLSTTIQQPVGHPQWGTEMADKIVWMAQKQIPSAQINLNPRHLGPVSIHIDVDKDQTSIAFHANNPLVKESIEAALPRLKEMLASQQLNLVDVNVSQQQSDQKQSSQAFFQQNKDENNRQNQSDFQKETLADSAAAVIDEIESGKAVVSQGILSLFA